MSKSLRIKEMLVTPVACPDPPLLNHTGVHEPVFLRAIVRMRTEDGGLYRTMRAGQAKIPGFLEDFAFLVHGLIELYRTEEAEHWLDAAEALPPTDVAVGEMPGEDEGDGLLFARFQAQGNGQRAVDSPSVRRR